MIGPLALGTSRATPQPEWRYWRAPTKGLLEVGTLQGATAPLTTHFHDEVQITFVTAGRRKMIVGGRGVEVEAGRCAIIPAGVAHAGLADATGACGFVIYVAAGDYAWAPMAAEIEGLCRAHADFRWEDIATIVQAHRTGAALGTGEIDDLAEMRRKLSREGFSRLFARRTGMPPHAYELVARLNRARRLLQGGEPVASVAAETRFADQSHFGRWFRRAFGTTPAQYRRGYQCVTDVPDVTPIAGL